ncbi:OmpA family protein [Granulosicoccus sp.]|nr:OmpA family protein [Granulosicoccus sp.]MDB4224491.1 OmpA family protein [Granulosicoccus sp.]
MKNTFAVIAASLLLTGTMTLATTTFADGHETVESLKAELAGVQSTLSQITAGRDYLTERLRQQLASAKDTASAHAAELAQAKTDGDSMADAAFVQIKSALAERDTARDELAAANAANAKLALDMESVINGRTYIEKQATSAKATASGLQEELAAANAANEKLALDMESVINGRTYIEKLAANAKAAAAADMTAAASEKAKLESQLATAIRGRSHVMERWKSVQAELSGMKEKAAMAEQAANWGSNVSASLASRLDHLSGVEVTATSDNKVNLRIRSAGMFKSGGQSLSSEGKNLLEQVGLILQGQSDASILVTGHTDNIPTGKGSRYKDNVDLSNQRAAEAMNHLGTAAGIDFERMSSSGVGDAQPITSNATADGREMNRRVDIILSAM